MSTQRTAVFVDILGFGDLVEADDSLVGLVAFPTRRRTQRDALAHTASAEAALLAKRFYAFHSVLRGTLEQFETRSELTSLVFSDSAFAVFEDATASFSFAVRLMRRMLRGLVPVRMGIGQGSFKALRFFTDTSESLNAHGAQFTGQAIVRAVRAEGCGLPGCRIFLHEAMVSTAPHSQYGLISVSGQNLKHPVSRELNYAMLDREEIDPTQDPELHAANLYDEDLIRHVSNMRGISPPNRRLHYEATLEAFNQMRIARGRTPLMLSDEEEA